MYIDSKIERLKANICQLRERNDKANEVIAKHAKSYIRAKESRERETDATYAAELDERIKTLEEYSESKVKFIKENIVKIKLLEQQIKDIKKQEEDNRIPAIEEFMDGWEIKSKNYYTRAAREYKHQAYLHKKSLQDLRENYSSYSYEYKSQKNKLYQDWKTYSDGIPNIVKDSVDTRLGIVVVDKLYSLISEERYRKTKNLIDRVQNYVGKITDAKGLYVSPNLELNGLIIGTNGKAVVETVYAGGYNVQCLHFRLLINRIL